MFILLCFNTFECPIAYTKTNAGDGASIDDTKVNARDRVTIIHLNNILSVYIFY